MTPTATLRNANPTGPDPTTEPARRVNPPVMDRLHAWGEQVQGDIALADAKASTLLGWAGTALALVATVLVSLSTRLPSVLTLAGVIGLSGLGCLAWCVIALVLVIRPRLGGSVLGGYSYNTEDRGFIAFANLAPGVIVDAACADSEPQADPSEAIRRIQLLARIALAKHRLLRLACTLLLVSMPLIAIAGTAMAAGLTGGGAR